jgi:two-component system, chemotaxis family, chemotaxis protein CheY
MKVLVVDDSSTMRKIVMKNVRMAANRARATEPQFVEASDGNEALEALGKLEDIELVLCDVNMPNMDGLTFVRTLRKATRHQERNFGDWSLLQRVSNRIPIIMITTEGGLGKAQEALEAGANDFLTKPFTPDQLVEKIGRYLIAG